MMINKIISSFLLLFMLGLCACNKPERAIEKPNLVLILVDDYGYADISFEGNTQITTPAIDKIAQEGVQFTNFYQSAAACAPTRASLLTGRYHLRTGVWGVHWGRDFIAADETTFADLAKEAGYVTGAFGKWHSGKSTGYHSWNRGFDVGLESNLYQYFNTNVLMNNKLVNVAGPITNVVTDNAIQFIEENRDTSFLCYIPYQSIHEPFNCPDDLFKKYKERGYTDHVARLYGMIEVLDENIGRVSAKITELGLDDNTVIMFMVDDGCSPGFDLTYSTRRMNAEEKAERRKGWAKELRGTKANIFEGGVKSPCYMRWQGKLQAGKQVHTVSGVIDVLPTLADICGFEIPSTNLPIDGKSLYPLLVGESKELDDRYYFDNTNLYRISMDRINMEEPEIREMYVRHKNFKLIRYDGKLNGTEGVFYNLYDLSKDEKEEHNVMDHHLEMAATLKDTLALWFAEMVKSPNAFKICTYNIGDWNERSTFINLDGVCAKNGTLKRDEGPGFEFTNWDTPGNSLSYNINVLEESNYVVEFIIDANKNDFGSKLKVFTENDTADVIIDHTQQVKSKILTLPKGQQTLTVQLVSTASSGKAMTWMKNIIVHRIPSENDNVIKNPKLAVHSPSLEKEVQVQMANAPFEFCTNPGYYGKTIEITPNEELTLNFVADNIEEVKEVTVYVDFEQVHQSNRPQEEYKLRWDKNGLYTINVEYLSNSNDRCNVLLNVQVKR